MPRECHDPIEATATKTMHMCGEFNEQAPIGVNMVISRECRKADIPESRLRHPIRELPARGPEITYVAFTFNNEMLKKIAYCMSPIEASANEEGNTLKTHAKRLASRDDVD